MHSILILLESGRVISALLLQKILHSCFLQGGMIIPEEQLANQYGVSRTPIREAIRRLAEYGLVILKPRSHAMVYKVEDKEAEDIAKVRVALEKLAIEMITPESLEKHIEELSRLAADCQYHLTLGDRAQLFVKDSLFHLELVKCAENDALFDLYERLDSRVQLLRIAQNLSDGELSDIISQHPLLLQHLKKNDKNSSLELIVHHVAHNM